MSSSVIIIGFHYCYLGKRWPSFLYPTLAHWRSIFTADMTTYYCHTLEEALKRAKAAGKRPGYWYGGIVLKSGKKGFAVYREGKVIEQYSVIGRNR